MLTILVLLIIVFAITGPGYGWRAGPDPAYGPRWGYYPGGFVGLLVLVLVLMLIAGAFPPRWGW
jgi:hypothetical protein